MHYTLICFLIFVADPCIELSLESLINATTWMSGLLALLWCVALTTWSQPREGKVLDLILPTNMSTILCFSLFCSEEKHYFLNNSTQQCEHTEIFFFK